MALTEEDLIPGYKYINRNHGICIFNKVAELELKGIKEKYYLFLFADNGKLYVPVENIDMISKIDARFANAGLSKLDSNGNWEEKYNKDVRCKEITDKAEEAISQYESYKNILNSAIESNVIAKCLNKFTNNKEVEDFIIAVLTESVYPKGFRKEIAAQYEYNSRTLIIEYRVPNTNEVPRIINYKFNSKTEKVTNITMKEKDFIKHYEDIIFQITLRTIKEVFDTSESSIIESVVFNGWTDTIDKRTGADLKSCIITIMVSRDKFQGLNLARVSLKDCIQYLKGIYAGQLSQLAPVKPIMDINKEDKRFVDGKNVLSDIDAGVNLAEMDWEDFEHLVRELFGNIFSSDGSEVKVTQASRDGGVDAVAFDNDPIKGGKYIIQAKRYNNVVPVSAARDLYGTVINEGANKGILVTTSYFGNDTREFAKDKPITLIEGSNLIYLLNEYGYKAHIKLKKELV